MPGPHVDALVAKYEAEDAAAGADPAVESPSAPPAGVSAAGSAPADDVVVPSEQTPAPEPSAPKLDHGELASKLATDRARRSAKQNRRQAKADAEAAAKTKADAEAELAKWKALGKDQSFLDAIKAAGHDPRVVYEQMRKEALTAGTPEAKLDAITKQLDAEREARLALEKKLEEKDAKAEQDRKDAEERAENEAHAREFESDFRACAKEDRYAPLRKEYGPDTLFALATNLSKKPELIFAYAKKLNVPLTERDGHFRMQDIWNVMLASQAAHHARMQQPSESAGLQTSETPPQGSSAKQTVNGTAARKAEPPTVIGNTLITARASEADKLKGMTREQRVEYLKNRHPGDR